ncbi:M20/M25/M40 family metallo-hydrolase [Demequina sp. SYSU T00039]|uniref:M20/M25/M40 family metallo-hydrolase n=1 Tax=Demequina lignilytica TaxID=3051663 RepID=A0AAW7M7M0_9MICO|nr:MULTISPECIES: M20/M25/M40 family metallo-hydrolase [unclassified Demequina]MDN4479050.1 M20/M25/M40 family metallo-hydrolase [Demequina sp. SYSU T00039-1]MDN4489031.1 M20/M25/M40 family metallo-hydrolase [Demequina sp. SYSU T00039]MDN4491258.1 M20/M25/M40 family metallo-hydrolase [Demequina sp. SYSU T00068]
MTESDVVRLARDLIRIDTSNYGDVDGPGERAAAEYVAAYLSDLGLEPVIRESEPGRASLTALWEGSDRTRPPLVLHGHLDVVPAFREDWTVEPFAAEVKDGMIWGRGAVDMKGVDAMYLAAIGRMIRAGAKPARDIVIAFFADEEHGGHRGAKWMVQHHPDDFRGATEAVSEVGGFSIQVGDRRVYLFQTGEKGMQWVRLAATGVQGHGSLVHRDNAVAHLAGAMHRIGQHVWPMEITPPVETLLRGIADILGIDYAEDPETVDRIVAGMGAVGRMVEASLRNTSNPTMLDAGYKVNVIPDTAGGFVDSRFLHGQQEQVLRKLEELAGTDVKVEPYILEQSIELPFDAPLVHKAIAAIKADDPDAVVLPYSMMGGTDNKHLATIGIAGYGFAPLRLPPELDFPGLFHGIDERVPLDSLEFGTDVMVRFLADC